jgi:hypothetical protein
VNGCDRVFTVTEKDREKLISLYNLPPEKIVNISVGADIDAENFTLPSKRERQERDKILYLSGNYPAAREAAVRIVEAAKKLPQKDFLVAGLICSAEAFCAEDLPSNLYLYGVVSESAKNELLKTCDLAINPVTSGAGINMKLIEDFAFGIPVLTTAHGARGIPLTDKVEAIIEDGTNLAAAIEAFFETDINFRDRLSQNAYDMACRDRRWGSVAERMVKSSGLCLPQKSNKNNFDFMSQQANDLAGKTVFMWGAGEQGIFCLSEIKRRQAKNIRIIDGNQAKQGKYFEKILIEPPSEFYRNHDSLCVISVGALTDAVDIYKTIIQNGVCSENIIIARGPLFNPSFIDRDKLG